MSEPAATSSRKQPIFLIVGLVAMGIILLLPCPDPVVTGKETLALLPAGKAALAVLAMAVVFWASEALPFPVTGLLAMAMMVMTKVATLKELVQWGFGNTIIMFFIGVLIFSAALTETSLLKRLTGLMLFRLGHRPEMIILIFIVVGALISAWITDMAVAAMLMPIGVSILRDAKVEPLKSNFGKALMISCAWGPHIGGIATPAGCGPNPLTMGFLRDLAGVDFSFVDWMIVGFPAALLMIPVGWFLLIRIFPIEPIDLSLDEETWKRNMDELGPISKKEIATLAIFAVMVILWLFPKQIQGLTGGAVDYLDIRFVAIACACLFFFPGIQVISWKRAESQISWGGIILVAAGLSLGKATHATGGAAWLAYVAFNKLGSLPPAAMVFAVVFGVSLLKVMFSSNTVTGAIMVPLLIALAKSLDLDPVLVAVPAGITASLAFILVTTTPTNVIPYSAGYFTIGDMAKSGLIMVIPASLCVTISVCVFGRLFGIVTF